MEAVKEMTSEEKFEKKKKYVSNAEIGTLIAFKQKSGKVNSAKIVGKDDDSKMLKAETKYGAKFDVKYSDVIWVKTGARWPKGVYRLLKGIKENNGEEKAE
jgi:hypothetical protein